MTSRFALVAVVIAMTTFASTASAALVLDQQNLADGALAGQGIGRFNDGNGAPDPAGTSFNFQDSQTFTVGVAGLLAQVHVPILNTTNNPTLPVTLSIIPVIAGIPSPTTILGSITLPGGPALTAGVTNGNPASWANFDVSSLGIQVGVGQVLAYSLSTASPIPYLYNPELTNTYAPGEGFRRNAALTTTWSSFGAQAGVDFLFQTFVSVIPEPATATLAILGMGGLLLRRRRVA